MFEYHLISFNHFESDQLKNDDTWYQYVIANQFNRITGYRSGQADDVKRYIEDILDYQNRKLLLNQNHYERQNFITEYTAD